MNRRTFLAFSTPLLSAPLVLGAAARVRTELSIRADDFYLNNKPSYAGRTWNGAKVEGLLVSAGTPPGDFSASLEMWHAAGVMSFTVNLYDGGEAAFDEKGGLRRGALSRVAAVLDRAEELGMAPMLGCCNAASAAKLKNVDAVKRGVVNVARWLLDRGSRHVMLEIARDCDRSEYSYEILKAKHIHELITLAQEQRKDGDRLLVSASFSPGTVPAPNVIRASDFILLRGNTEDPARLIGLTRQVRGFSPKPVVLSGAKREFLASALGAHVSWGASEIDGEVLAKIKEITASA